MSPVARWAVRALRDLGLNVLGFGLVFAVVAILAVAVRTGMEPLLRWGQPWLALVFVVWPRERGRRSSASSARRTS